MRLALLIGVAVAGLKAKALLSYQLPVIVTCCIQSFLANCNFDHDCAMARFLANATLNNAGDTLLQNCVEAEKASINGSPGILERARALAAMPGCLRQGTKGSAKTRIWMSLSVKDQAHDLSRFLLHHWCLGRP